MKMEQSKVQKLAKVLRVLVIIAFVCNILALYMVPALAMMRGNGNLLELIQLASSDGIFSTPKYLILLFNYAWRYVWTSGVYAIVLTCFLWACGICTAVVLWQAKKVLGTVIEGRPFDPANSRRLMRAAVCCAVIAAAAFARLIWGFCFYKSIAPLLTYNALFVPVFAMGFLLCMVMSALFRQANELKEENDLTI